MRQNCLCNNAPEKRRKLGSKTAETLLQEIHIPNGVKFQSSYTNLMSNVPDRNGLSFFEHIEGTQKKQVTKENLLHLLDDIVDNTLITTFCCASLEVNVVAGFDVDHVFPFARIRKKQEALLQYLNDPVNIEFAEGFLETTFYVEVDMKKEVGRKLQPKKTLTIKDYFQRDHHDNQIKGTQFFFEACYNDISNLLHIKHEINRIKGDLPPLKWIEIVFSENLMKSLVDAGGIHEGIILDKIFKVENIESFQTFRFITDPTGVSVNEYFTVHVHEGSGVGIGKFILDWFTKKHKLVCKDAEKILEVRNKLTDMLRESIDDTGEDIISATEKAIEIIRESLNTINYHYGIIRSGSEVRDLSHGSKADSEEARIARKAITRAALLKGIDYMHRLKEAKKHAEGLLTREAEKSKLKKHFYVDCFNGGLHELDPGGVEIAFKKFREELFAKTNKKKNLSYYDVKNAAIAAKSWSEPAAREKRAEEQGKAKGMVEGKAEEAKIAAYITLTNLRDSNVPPGIASLTACRILTDAQFTETEANTIVDEMIKRLKDDLTIEPAQTPKLKVGDKRPRAKLH